jgi:tryptophan synthase beta chain
MSQCTALTDGTDTQNLATLPTANAAVAEPLALKRALLGGDDVPGAWYNLAADLPEPVPPPLDPRTGRPLAPEDLEPIFARALIAQEMTRRRWIEIPDDVRRGLAIWRPTPLVRAYGLERALKTPARIYFKDESQSPPGSHKSNTAIPQAYYSKQEGVRRLTTETGAGQWGSSLAMACSLFGLECQVFMVRLTYEQKPYRRSMTQLWGGRVTASPSGQTEAGRQVLAADPDCPGSLGIAISEAVETAYHCDQTKYAMGSVLNHVMLHQTIIGLEARQQFDLFGDSPDVIIGCAGGGSNFAGLAFPYFPDKLRGRDIRLIAAESRACPTMTRGRYHYDFGDTTKLTPLVKMFTLGHGFVPPRIQAGGLRYHGPAGQPGRAPGSGRGRLLPPTRVLRGRQALRCHRRDHSRPGDRSCHPRRGERGRPLPGDGRGKVHRAQLQRPRPLRPGLLRQVSRRGAGRPRRAGGEHGRRAGRAA